MPPKRNKSLVIRQASQCILTGQKLIHKDGSGQSPTGYSKAPHVTVNRGTCGAYVLHSSSAPSGTRTHTGQILSLLPLPIGL